MKLSSLAAAFALVAATVPALADTAEQRAACTPDVWRLCASHIPDVGAIKSCLRSEKPRLSPACRTVMDTFDKPQTTLASAR